MMQRGENLKDVVAIALSGGASLRMEVGLLGNDGSGMIA